MVNPGQRLQFALQANGFLNVIRIGRMPATLLLIKFRAHRLQLLSQVPERRIGR